MSCRRSRAGAVSSGDGPGLGEQRRGGCCLPPSLPIETPDVPPRALLRLLPASPTGPGPARRGSTAPGSLPRAGDPGCVARRGWPNMPKSPLSRRGPWDTMSAGRLRTRCPRRSSSGSESRTAAFGDIGTTVSRTTPADSSRFDSTATPRSTRGSARIVVVPGWRNPRPCPGSGRPRRSRSLIASRCWPPGRADHDWPAGRARSFSGSRAIWRPARMPGTASAARAPSPGVDRPALESRRVRERPRPRGPGDTGAPS